MSKRLRILALASVLVMPLAGCQITGGTTASTQPATTQPANVSAFIQANQGQIQFGADIATLAILNSAVPEADRTAFATEANNIATTLNKQLATGQISISDVMTAANQLILNNVNVQYRGELGALLLALSNQVNTKAASVDFNATQNLAATQALALAVTQGVIDATAAYGK